MSDFGILERKDMRWCSFSLRTLRSFAAIHLGGGFAALRICLLLLFCPLLLGAVEPARLPYELIYQFQKTQATLSANHTNLVIFLRMSSSLPEVGVRDLVVYIDSKAGHIPVELDRTDGTFTVPMRESLLAEHPFIVVNQPKDTMKLEWYVGLKVATVFANSARYGEVMRPLKDLEVIRAEMKKIPGIPDLTIYGLKLIYPADKEASVVIHCKSGDRVLKTDPAHVLVIPYEQALLAEDPVVNISLPPLHVDVANLPPDKAH